MKRKVGPLAVWQWALVVGGGLGAYLLYRRSKAGKEGTESVALPETRFPGAPVLEGSGGGGSAGGASGLDTTPTPAGAASSAAPPPEPAGVLTTFPQAVGLIGESENALLALGIVRPAATAPTEHVAASKTARSKATGKLPARKTNKGKTKLGSTPHAKNTTKRHQAAGHHGPRKPKRAKPKAPPKPVVHHAVHAAAPARVGGAAAPPAAAPHRAPPRHRRRAHH